VVYSKSRQTNQASDGYHALKSSMVSIEDIIEKINNTPYDISIYQEHLDLTKKSRTSLFPWRGQFSPELVEVLLDQYSQSGNVILDPFVGSGTTLFEAARKGFKCYGAEINPSAVEMAKTSQFANVPLVDRRMIIREMETLTKKYLNPFSIGLFADQTSGEKLPQDFERSRGDIFRSLMHNTENNPLVQNIIVNAIIRYMSYRESDKQKDFFRALHEHTKIIENLPYSKEECQVFHQDARSIPLVDSSVDLIITSPPYINVFNYHQNNRPAMELIGWDLLNIAKSEIGSNRKNRQNRFLTVVQYALDILDALIEMRRLLSSTGRAIIVVGRESSVRGASFKNGIIVASLALGGANFKLDALQERKFTNRFGEIIYEDILHLIPGPDTVARDTNIAQSVALWSLGQPSNLDEQVNLEILEAKKRAATVQRSPIFRILDTSQEKTVLSRDNEGT
jgi:DNA modification methylase